MSERVLQDGERSYIPINATSPLSEQQCNVLQMFRRRHDFLYQNILDLGSGPLLGFSFQQSDGKVKSELRYNIHRLKGVYLDYRVFDASKEKTSFLNMIELITAHFDNERLRVITTDLQRDWSTHAMSDWFGHSLDELIKVIFNSELFHTDISKSKTLTDMLRSYDKESLHSFLLYGISSRLQQLHTIEFIIRDCSKDNQVARLPIRRDNP